MKNKLKRIFKTYTHYFVAGSVFFGAGILAVWVVLAFQGPSTSPGSGSSQSVDRGTIGDYVGSLTANNGMYSEDKCQSTPSDGAECPSADIPCDTDTEAWVDLKNGRGYCIEVSERTADYFEDAKTTCTTRGSADGGPARLSEPYEWKLACKLDANAGSYSGATLKCYSAGTWSTGTCLNTMTDNWEWASNFTLPLYYGSDRGVAAAIFGNGGCHYASASLIGHFTGSVYSQAFRCAR